MPGKVVSVEYDPNRSARICLVQYVDGEKRYIIWPVGVKVGDTVMSGPEAEIKPGNALPLTNIPSGTMIHNIEMHKGKGAPDSCAAPAARRSSSAATKATRLVRLPSGEVRRILAECMATIGQVGNVGAQPDQAGPRRAQAA